MSAYVMAADLGAGVMSGESKWISQAKQGDLHAFNQLVLTYQSLAFNVAYGILGDSDAAVDATQDSFLKAYKAMERFWGSSFRAWLMRIVTNTCYDQLRTRKRLQSRQRSLEELVEKTENAPALCDRRAGPYELAEGAELSHTIRRGINLLPPEQRTVAVLFDVEGFSYEEICQITGMPMGTVKSRLSRARARLRDYLQGYGYHMPSRSPCSLA